MTTTGRQNRSRAESQRGEGEVRGDTRFTPTPSLRRDPLKTYSTTASDRPALCRKGRNCLAFCAS
ncbi:hypothetical protein EYF80_034016 [Liparis tanakae]|uniref:Uncharacterized protein n=1 Tax=Liparis tanakae TaxID=230148 RepID=A0A4Z2GQ14_9TELE|nr:hypothetical protein EYF80_034016 [Liparis tanakae]